MITSIVLGFPAEWRCTVTVERPTSGQWGLPGEPTRHTVPDCMVSAIQSEEEAQSRSDDPDTSAWLYAPVGADFQSIDRVLVPSSPIRPSGWFRVTGKPRSTPLGLVVPLGEAVTLSDGDSEVHP